MKYIIFCISIIFLFPKVAHSQRQENDSLIVGKVIPDYTFGDVKYYKSTAASISDFRGKWLIMDFGGPNCASCIAHIPDFNDFQHEFGKQLQVLLIENLEPTYEAVSSKDQDWKAKTYELYDKIRKKRHIDLPIAFDSVLYHKYDISGMPAIIIVDPDGVVRFTTGELKRSDILDILSGKTPTLEKMYTGKLQAHMRKYNFHAPLLTNGLNGNGGSDTGFFYRSILTFWNDSQPGWNIRYLKGSFEAYCLDLTNLYKLAYLGKADWGDLDTVFYGKFYYEPLLLTKDSLFFHTSGSYSVSQIDRLHTFSYSLTLPGLNPDWPRISDNDKNKIHHILQRELSLNFPYVATVEKHKRRVYRLISNPNIKSKVRTTGGIPSVISHKSEGIQIKNAPFKVFKNWLALYFPHWRTSIIIDETGLDNFGNVDINFDCKMEDYSSIVKELKKIGISLVADEKEMNVLVIRDGNSAN